MDPVPSLLNCVSEEALEYQSWGTWQHRGAPEDRQDWGAGQAGPASDQLGRGHWENHQASPAMT